MEAETLRLFAAVALVLPGVFYIGFGNVLVVRPQSTAIAMLVIIALLIGVWGHWTNRLSVFLVLALALPSYQYLVFQILHQAFVLRFQRSPETAASTSLTEYCQTGCSVLLYLLWLSCFPCLVSRLYSAPDSVSVRH